MNTFSTINSEYHSDLTWSISREDREALVTNTLGLAKVDNGLKDKKRGVKERNDAWEKLLEGTTVVESIDSVRSSAKISNRHVATYSQFTIRTAY